MLMWCPSAYAPIAQAIDGLRADDHEAERLVQKVSRAWVVQRLQEEATNTDNSAATRVRALELLGKTFSMFTGKLVADDEPRSSEEIERELRERMERLIGQYETAEA